MISKWQNNLAINFSLPLRVTSPSPFLPGHVRGRDPSGVSPSDEVGSVRLQILKNGEHNRWERICSFAIFTKWQPNPEISPGLGGSGSTLVSFLPEMNGIDTIYQGEKRGLFGPEMW